MHNGWVCPHSCGPAVFTTTHLCNSIFQQWYIHEYTFHLEFICISVMVAGHLCACICMHTSRANKIINYYLSRINKQVCESVCCEWPWDGDWSFVPECVCSECHLEKYYKTHIKRQCQCNGHISYVSAFHKQMRICQKCANEHNQLLLFRNAQ